MNIKRFIKNLLKYRIEFDCEWDTNGDYYYITLILGNIEYIIHENDTDMMKRVWNEICEYWI